LMQGCLVAQALIWSRGDRRGAHEESSSVLWYRLLRSVASGLGKGGKIDFCAIDHTEH
jgi:hypothetical protein